jgi:hypothetical protein
MSASGATFRSCRYVRLELGRAQARRFTNEIYAYPSPLTQNRELCAHTRCVSYSMCPSDVGACTSQAFYESGEDNAVFLSKLEEIKATHR